MIAALALGGWAVALTAAVRTFVLGRRLELVACAEHELRGPLAALTLAAARSRQLEPAVIEGQLERARAALADLAAARHGGRARTPAARHELRAVIERVATAWAGTGAQVTLDWQAGDAAVHSDPARVSQALGNLLSNALEHGRGHAEVRGVRVGDRVRVEVANRPRAGRGRGLAIATRAAEEAGGRLGLKEGREGVVASIELPLADA